MKISQPAGKKIIYNVNETVSIFRCGSELPESNHTESNVVIHVLTRTVFVSMLGLEGVWHHSPFALEDIFPNNSHVVGINWPIYTQIHST